MNPFHYAMRTRQMQIEKQKEQDARNQQANNQRIMGQKTDNTGLYGANKSLIKQSEYDTIKRVLDNNKAVQTATKTLNTNLYNNRNKQIDNKNKRQF